MNIIEEIINKIRCIILLALFVYVGFHFFLVFFQETLRLSVLTGIGFVISVIIAFFNGVLSLRTLSLLFVVSIISFIAGSLLPNFVDIFLSGELFSSLLYFVVILIIWVKGQEIKGYIA